MTVAFTIARAYQHSFESHPNTTLAITGGCLNTLADVVAQVSQNTVRPSLGFGVFLLMYPCRY
jgi:protein Mpv17